MLQMPTLQVGKKQKLSPNQLEKLYRHVYLFRHTNPHDPAHHPFLSVNVYEALVNAHLPPVPRGSSFPTRRLQNWDLQPLRRKRNRPVHFHAGLLGNETQLLADLLKLPIVGTCQANSCFSSQSTSFPMFLHLNRFIAYLP